VYAARSDSDEMEARVRICRVDLVWMVVSVRDASEAEGRRASEGSVVLDRAYAVPWVR